MGVHWCILFLGAGFCIAAMLLPSKEQDKYKSTRSRSSRKARTSQFLLLFFYHFPIRSVFGFLDLYVQESSDHHCSTEQNCKKRKLVLKTDRRCIGCFFSSFQGRNNLSTFFVFIQLQNIHNIVICCCILQIVK